MEIREAALSSLFLAVVALKISEALLRIEAWPASNVSMFSGARPLEAIPSRYRLMAVRAEDSVELSAADFLLSEDQFESTLFPDDGVARRCQGLIDSWNRLEQDPDRRIEIGYVLVEPIPRPGKPSGARAWRVTCSSYGIEGPGW